MIVRNDLRKPQEVPKDLLLTVLVVGGTNPFNEPLYRVILAEDHVCQSGGMHTDWDDDVAIEDRGGTGIEDVQRALNQYYKIMEVASRVLSVHAAEELSRKLGNELDDMLKSRLTAQPRCVEEGMRQVQIYPFEGFILEKWKPAESFGSQEGWYQYKVNGMSALGAYPTHGEYEHVAGPTPYLPSEEQITDAIKQDFRNIQNRPPSPRERVLRMLEKQDLARKAKEKEKRNFAESFHKDLNPIMRTLSLGAGRVRNALAKRAGIKEHVGN